MRKLMLGLAVLLISISISACGGQIKTIVLKKNDPEHIWLQYLIDDNDQVIPQGFSHPSDLKPEQIKTILESVELEENSFFAWRNQGRLFSSEEVNKLVVPLAEALQKATPDQWVHFAVSAMKTKLLLPTRVLNDGICYLKDGKFNLVLGNINFELLEPDEEFYKRDPRDLIYLNARRLKLNPDQGISAPPIVPGDRRLEKQRRNWLVYDLPKFFAAKVEAAKPEAVPVKPDIVERLKKLKELLDQGMITQEEYDKQRQKILEEL